MEVNMVDRAITGLFMVVAIVHFLPIIGVIGNERLESLYDVKIEGANMEILMRHRAVMFGMLGAFIGYAAFQQSLQPLAFIAAFISLAAFFYLTYAVGGYTDAIWRLVIGDAVAAVALVGAIILYMNR